MEERLSESLVDRRTPMVLATGFAVVALFLAGIGIYGVLAYQVSQRRREIGIRMALGAANSSIFTLVLREGAMIVAFGTALRAWPARSCCGRRSRRSSTRSAPWTPASSAPWPPCCVAVALVACVLPARRAAKTDPMIALSE